MALMVLRVNGSSEEQLQIHVPQLPLQRLHKMRRMTLFRPDGQIKHLTCRHRLPTFGHRTGNELRGSDAWEKFGQPVRAGSFRVADGSGREWIFRGSATNTAPATPVTTAAQRLIDDFVPDWVE